MRMLLLALACTLATAASAKELPRRQVEEPKKTDTACAYLGEGYTRVPGSDTCIKVGGRVRVDAQVLWGRP